MASERALAVQQSLIRHAAVMTLLGLLSGFTTAFAKSPEAALSAHTIGTLQGALLFGFAAAWPAFHASARTLRVLRLAMLGGCYANWLGSQLAGFWSAKKMFLVNADKMPDGAAGWQEGVVIVLLNISILVIVACVMLIWVAKPAKAEASASA